MSADARSSAASRSSQYAVGPPVSRALKSASPSTGTPKHAWPIAVRAASSSRSSSSYATIITLCGSSAFWPRCKSRDCRSSAIASSQPAREIQRPADAHVDERRQRIEVTRGSRFADGFIVPAGGGEKDREEGPHARELRIECDRSTEVFFCGGPVFSMEEAVEGQRAVRIRKIRIEGNGTLGRSVCPREAFLDGMSP